MKRLILLLVDAVDSHRAALANSFSQQFAIAQAVHCGEAAAYVQAHSADIAMILLHMTPPVSNGIGFLKWISHSGYGGIPVMAITADSSCQKDALESGAWDFMTMPAELESLNIRVNNVLKRSGVLRERELTEELKSANAELEKTKHQMDHLIHSIPGGIAIYRMTDRFETLYFSDGVAELSGHTRAEYSQWVGNDASAAIFEADRDRLLPSAMELLRSGKPIDEIYRIYHKDGHLVWVHLNGLPMEQTAEGTLVYAVFQSLSSQAKLYRSVLDETQIAVYVCDSDTYDILYFNQQMARFANAESTAVTGKKCYESLFHRDAPCTFCRMNSMQKDRMTEREFTYPVNNRTYLMKGKLTDWDQRTAHIEYIEDITDRKAAEEKSAALLTQLASIMEHVPGALCLYRVNGTAIEPIVHNQAFYQVLGYSEKNAKAVNRRTDYRNVHPEDLAGLQAFVRDAIADSKAGSYTYRLYHDIKDCWIWLRMNINVVAQPDGAKLAYCAYTDITEEKEAEQIAIAAKERSEEQYRRQMQAMERVNDSGLIAKGYCNLTQNRMAAYSGSDEGSKVFAAADTFDEALSAFAGQVTPPEKAEELLRIFDRETLIRNF